MIASRPIYHCVLDAETGKPTLTGPAGENIPVLAPVPPHTYGDLLRPGPSSAWALLARAILRHWSKKRGFAWSDSERNVQLAIRLGYLLSGSVSLNEWHIQEGNLTDLFRQVAPWLFS